MSVPLAVGGMVIRSCDEHKASKVTEPVRALIIKLRNPNAKSEILVTIFINQKNRVRLVKVITAFMLKFENGPICEMWYTKFFTNKHMAGARR